MGCAFSSTQIFLLDSKHTEKKENNNNNNFIKNNNNSFAKSLLLHARQGIGLNRTTVIGSGGALLLATKYGKDVILVGQLKSNGTYSRRRPSSEAKFIEQRRKLSNKFKEEIIKEEENQSSSSIKNILYKRSNRLADSSTIAGGDLECNNGGPIDFQKRLENLKIKKSEEIINDELMNISEENLNNEFNLKIKKNNNNILPKTVEEKEVIMHRAEQESIMTSDGVLDQYSIEWDALSNTTTSADCCSQIGGKIGGGGLQQQPLHDGDVSEASFVLVKRKLKVAWEHRQIRQLRKQSLLRKEKNLKENSDLTLPQTTTPTKLSNNWIPEITYLIDENEYRKYSN